MLIRLHIWERDMAATVILVESDQSHITDWTNYVKKYRQEICKTPGQDLSGLPDPEVASETTLEQVLDIMGKASGGIAVIYAHAYEEGLLMRITNNAQSALAKNIRGVSRAWSALDEVIKLRSGDWSNPKKPEFLIDVPKAKELFKRLLQYLATFDGGFEKRLGNPDQVTNRDEADAWIDKWMDMMAMACLAPGLTQDDLRRVCRKMQKVRDARFQRVEIRACNIGKDKENLNALKEFFGAGIVAAPKTTMFFGKATVNLPENRDVIDDLRPAVQQLGGFRGTTFTAPRGRRHHLNHTPGGEPAMATGRRNRIFPSQNEPDAILQATEVSLFHYKNRVIATTATRVTRFVQANYKASATFIPTEDGLPVGGMWTPNSKDTTLPFLLPLEPAYRDFIVTSS
jgi:hypothetical protein